MDEKDKKNQEQKTPNSNKDTEPNVNGMNSSEQKNEEPQEQETNQKNNKSEDTDTPKPQESPEQPKKVDNNPNKPVSGQGLETTGTAKIEGSTGNNLKDKLDRILNAKVLLIVVAVVFVIGAVVIGFLLFATDPESTPTSDQTVTNETTNNPVTQPVPESEEESADSPESTDSEPRDSVFQQFTDTEAPVDPLEVTEDVPTEVPAL